MVRHKFPDITNTSIQKMLIGLLAFLSLGTYLVAASQTYRLGFPLDDAWIHQTYARNLVRYGEWSFIPGDPSAGSTAPLWSFVLGIGHYFGCGPYFWTYLLGGALLFVIALLAYFVHFQKENYSPGWSLFVGVMLIFEWHLVWAAGSGMETLLFTAIVLVCLLIINPWEGNIVIQETVMPQAEFSWPTYRWLVIGGFIGISIWVRPEGFTLLGPAVWGIIFSEKYSQKRLISIGLLLVGLASFIIPYFVFIRSVSGSWFPNTFFAKQAEYATMQQIPFFARYWSFLRTTLVGAVPLLIPGIVLHFWYAIQRRAWVHLGSLFWVLGFLAIFASRLPATYQHGRYIMPVIPLLYLWGLGEMGKWVNIHASGFWRRVLVRSWLAAVVVLQLVFWWLGGRTYALDVGIIESEMVDTARWLVVHTPQKALIAAHDIGALGYFAERPLLDLAGLVSPEVIPFIRDEDALSNYLDKRNATYLVTFPGWYPQLVQKATLVYQGNSQLSRSIGGENMAIYRWGIP